MTNIKEKVELIIYNKILEVFLFNSYTRYILIYTILALIDSNRDYNYTIHSSISFYKIKFIIKLPDFVLRLFLCFRG